MKILTGKITANKVKGVVTVEVARFLPHPMYRKRVKKTKLYHAQTSTGGQIGETVKIAERSPVSKTIKWQIIANKKDHAAA